MPKPRYIIAAVFALVLLVPAVSSANQCLICHSAMQGSVAGDKGTPVNLNVDGEKFASSVHGALQCTDCHTTYLSAPHLPPSGTVDEDLADYATALSVKSAKDPVALAACSRCHPTVYSDYVQSIHGKNLFEKKETDGPLCTDCHGSPHYIKPKSDPSSLINHANVLHTCGNCHENKAVTEKYDLSEHVIEKYLESFHGKKYQLGHQKVPICDDCHGGHAIVAVESEGSPVSGQGKVQTCGKCHEGAGPKFAAAPAHKYIGKDNPIPYWGEKLLILLLLGTFLFIVAHVILEAFSEARDYLLRKNDDKGGNE